MNRKKCLKSLPTQLQVPPHSPEEERELDYNICCCIDDIENTLSKNPTEKQKKLAEVSLRILKNPGESFIKKKQVLRQWCGDYKKKFEGEKKNITANLNNYRVTFGPSEVPCKSLYFKKHTLKSLDDVNFNGAESAEVSKKQNCECTKSNSFRFNF